MFECLTTNRSPFAFPSPPAGLSKLPNARKFNLGKYPSGSLRQRFPPPGLGFDTRPALSEAGFNLLTRLLELCPVSSPYVFSACLPACLLALPACLPACCLFVPPACLLVRHMHLSS